MKKNQKGKINFWFVLNEQEKDLLREEARESGVSMAKFLRQCIKYFAINENRDSLFLTERGQQLLNDIKYELNRYGNNLNQIAYKLNRNKYGFTYNEIKNMTDSLNNIQEGIENLKFILKTQEDKM